jgi:hypothetical protein
MQTYLVIITTALVLTQIIRLIQNTIQLKHLKKTDKRNADVEQLWNDLVNTMSELIEVTNRQIEEMGDFWK